jgi:hypothetical protein
MSKWHKLVFSRLWQELEKWKLIELTHIAAQSTILLTKPIKKRQIINKREEQILTLF